MGGPVIIVSFRTVPCISFIPYCFTPRHFTPLHATPPQIEKSEAILKERGYDSVKPAFAATATATHTTAPTDHHHHKATVAAAGAVDNEERKARTLDEMAKEAAWLRGFFPAHPDLLLE